MFVNVEREKMIARAMAFRKINECSVAVLGSDIPFMSLFLTAGIACTIIRKRSLGSGSVRTLSSAQSVIAHFFALLVPDVALAFLCPLSLPHFDLQVHFFFLHELASLRASISRGWSSAAGAPPSASTHSTVTRCLSVTGELSHHLNIAAPAR